MKTIVYKAAGGNPTAIVIGDNISQDRYPEISCQIQSKKPEIEQVGFFETVHSGVPKLQMAGGEFCGNASRSFACLLWQQNPKNSEFDFYVSGFNGVVRASVKKKRENLFFCEARFPNLKSSVDVKSLDGAIVKIVNLGGITHIVVSEDDFPFSDSDYEKDMKRIRDRLKVDNDAIGVIWTREESKQIYIRPVVWVKDVDSYYYETSCGSGSIAIGLIKKKSVDVVQPSGDTISVELSNGNMTLSSEMEKIMEF
ncbi:hypothetical protein GF382_01715 [Candidatus Falkowbacteria bacterium]|nr:hypothetical protein [Candidatus Falkowbacteria bacterium]